MSLVYDPYDRELSADPYPVYRKLRDDHPAYHNAELELWVLSRYADVSAALTDVETYSSANSITLGPASENIHHLPS